MMQIDLDQEGVDILMAYLDMATTRSGKIVLEDLRAAFFEGDNPGILEELEEYPHPYRPYVEIGLRMAYKKIIGAVMLAEQIRTGEVVIQPQEGNQE